MRKTFLSFLIFFVFFETTKAQFLSDTVKRFDTINTNTHEIKGVLLDINTNEPLPYANIYVLHQHTGTISNENGHFLLNIQALNKTDTVQFKYIGYTTKTLTISDLDSISAIYLKEEIFNLDEILVFANTPDARSIVRKVVKNLDSNYKETSCKKQIFIRERYNSELSNIKLNYKKSSIPDIDREVINKLESGIPKQSISYTDFLGNFYFSGNKNDSVSLKLEPLRTVALKDKNLAEFEELMLVFEDNLKNTKEGEYWKVKSGLFSQKLELDGDSIDRVGDTLGENERKLEYFRNRVAYQIKYSTLKDKDSWEFLYKTGKYEYSIAGGTRVNGEDVYIIDFEPNNSGLYTGRMYVAIESYALIRADYKYAPEKTGTDFHLFGVGYTENQFKGTVYFEKTGDYYKLKYFSKKAGSIIDFDRSLALLKKKERFLFDKKLNQIKVGVNISVNSEQLFECLIIDDKPISKEAFDRFSEKSKMKIIYVDKFDESLWKGYAIIEPTQQMKDYKKQLPDSNK